MSKQKAFSSHEILYTLCPNYLDKNNRHPLLFFTDRKTLLCIQFDLLLSLRIRLSRLTTRGENKRYHYG